MDFLRELHVQGMLRNKKLSETLFLIDFLPDTLKQSSLVNILSSLFHYPKMTINVQISNLPFGRKKGDVEEAMGEASNGFP